MRTFKYVLDYLLVAVRESAVYTARTYADELGQLYDGQEAQLKLAQEASAKHAKTILEQSAEILKLRDAIEAMQKARAAEKQSLFHERYSAGVAAFSRASTPQDEAIRRYCPNMAKEMGLGSVGDAMVYQTGPIAFDENDASHVRALGGRIDIVRNSFWAPCPSKYEKPSTKTPDHTWRANPDKKWETSYTKRVVEGLRDMRDRIRGIRDLRPDEMKLAWAIELLTDYHSTMHEVYEERDAARKTIADTAVVVRTLNEQYDWKKVQWETVLDTNAGLRKRIDSLKDERDFAKKQHEAALTSMGSLNKRISDLIKERDAASATVKARIREAVGL